MLDIVGFVIAIIVAIVAYRVAERKQQQKAIDGYTIKQLEDSGMDVSKEHRLEFWFYANIESGMKKLAQELEQRNFEVQLNETEQDPQYVIVAFKDMVPDLAKMQMLRQELVQLASANHVRFDGWGCSR